MYKICNLHIATMVSFVQMYAFPLACPAVCTLALYDLNRHEGPSRLCSKGSLRVLRNPETVMRMQ